MSTKVLFVNAVSCKAGGGLTDLANTLPLLGSALEELNWETHTWVVDCGHRALCDAGYAPPSLTVVEATSAVRRALWEFVQFPRIVRRRKPDVVFHFSNFIFRDLEVPQLTVLRSPTFFSPQYAIRRRTGVYQELRYRLGCRWSAQTVKRAASVFCISETHRNEIIETLGEIGAKVQACHLGITLPRKAAALRHRPRGIVLDQMPPEARAVLAPLRSLDRPVLLNVAHYYEHKNLGDLLEAARILKRSHPGVALVLTAGLTEYRGPSNTRTRHDTRLARELAAEGVLFDLGPVPKDWVWKLMALADVFAFPSSLESFGHPLLEAMSMGVPIVASDTPIHREITDGAALLHRVGMPEDIASAVERLFARPAERGALVEAGLRRSAQFSWQEHVDRLRDCIVESASN